MEGRQSQTGHPSRHGRQAAVAVFSDEIHAVDDLPFAQQIVAIPPYRRAVVRQTGIGNERETILAPDVETVVHVLKVAGSAEPFVVAVGFDNFPAPDRSTAAQPVGFDIPVLIAEDGRTPGFQQSAGDGVIKAKEALDSHPSRRRRIGYVENRAAQLPISPIPVLEHRPNRVRLQHNVVIQIAGQRDVRSYPRHSGIALLGEGRRENANIFERKAGERIDHGLDVGGATVDDDNLVWNSGLPRKAFQHLSQIVGAILCRDYEGKSVHRE